MQIPMIGIILVASGAIGAGMFSLPIISTGLWFTGSAVIMTLVWAANLAATLLYVEANLRFPAGASFNQVVRQSLDKTWGLLSNISIAFVLYILLYAFFSASGSLINQLFAESLKHTTAITINQGFASLSFGAIIATLVWAGTNIVGRVCAILMIGMGITFSLASSGMLSELNYGQLLASQNVNFKYAFATLPYFVTAFACAALVPTLVQYYTKDSTLVRGSFIWGTLIALAIYLLWNGAVFGVLNRVAMLEVIRQGGNMGELVASLRSVIGGAKPDQLDSILALFSCFAISTSFLSIGVSLVDFLSERFSLATTLSGRGKAVFLSFAPPAILSFMYPNGFVLAIGYAGLAVLFSFYVVPTVIALRYQKSNLAAEFSGSVTRLISIGILLIFTLAAIAAKLLTLLGVISAYP